MLKIKRFLLKPIELIYPLLKIIYPTDKVLRDKKILEKLED